MRRSVSSPFSSLSRLRIHRPFFRGELSERDRAFLSFPVTNPSRFQLIDAKHPMLPPNGYPLPPHSKDDDLQVGTWVIGTPMVPLAHPAPKQKANASAPVDYSQASSAAAYNPSYDMYSDTARAVPNNPYVHVYPFTGSSDGRTKENIFKVLDQCGKKLEQGTRKAGVLACNVWNHLNTGPSITDAAMARIAQRTKVFAEGGNDKIFQQNFGIYAGEQLRKAFACYLSTSTGPVIGTLYLSSLRLAFCSDNPVCHYTPLGQQEWVYYKVVIKLDQLSDVIPSSNPKNPAEKYIQIVTSDSHEFWFMGFVSYDKALKNLKDALQLAHRKYNQQL